MKTISRSTRTTLGRITGMALILVPLLMSCYLLCPAPVHADITVTATGQGGSLSQTVSGTGGPFALSLPLTRNAINTITVTATDTSGNKVSQDIKVTQLSLDQIVVSQVTAERLSVQQIKQLVNDGLIQLDNPANYNVSKFDIVLTIGDKQVPITVPVVTPIMTGETGWETYSAPPGGGGGGGAPPAPPPDVVVFDQQLAAMPGMPTPFHISGVIVIEGNIKSLKEFYTVRLLLMNTSGIFTLKNVTASIVFPDGGLSPISPTDGVISFGDILPGDGGLPGQAERQFIIRGDTIGVNHVQVNFGGTVGGPLIPDDQPIPFNGSAVTQVEVKGPPTFKVVVTHPDSVTVNVPYELKVDITDTGDIEALYTSLALDVGGAAELVRCEPAIPPSSPVCTPITGSDVRSFGDILPGQTVSATFTINPFQSGPISSCLGISDQNIALQVQVGTSGCLVGQIAPERGVPDGVPTVQVAPAPGLQGVSVQSPVTAFFSQEMNTGTITTGSSGTFNVFDASNNIVPGNFNFIPLNGKTVAVWQAIDPVFGGYIPLTFNAHYTVHITQGITNLDGTPLYSSWTSRFTTTGTGADDSTPPTLNLGVESPVNPSYVLPGQLVKIDAYAADQGSGIVRVELRSKDLTAGDSAYQFIDRRVVFIGDKPPFIFTIDSGKLTPGHTYQLLGTAYDAMMNSQNATINLIIAASAAAPTITLPASPDQGIPQGISISITPEAVTGGVTGVSYYLDGAAAPYKTVSIPPYQVGFGTVTLALGSHTIRAVAVDGLGQTGETTYSFTLVMNPNKPQITLTGAVSGATYIVGSSFVVSGTASDPVGISSLIYFLDTNTGLPLATGNQPFSIATAGLNTGPHQIIAQAVNTLGVSNTVTSSFNVAPLPTGPPPPAPVISTVSLPVNGQVTVTGSSAGGARIDINNSTQKFGITINADSAGNFSGSLAAAGGDLLSIVAYDYTTSQQPSLAATRTVPVPPTLTSISASPLSLSFTTANAWQDLTVTGNYGDGSAATLTGQSTFSSNNPSVAAVNASGRVVAFSNGSATITITSGGQQTQVPVTVNTALDTPPQVRIVSPATGGAVQRGDNVSVTVRATDQVGGVTRVVFSVTGPGGLIFTDTHYIAPAALDATSVFTFTIPDTVAVGAGLTVTAGAVDTSNTTAQTASIALNIVDTTLPLVSITAPLPQAPYNYGDTITLTVHATDRVGVSHIGYAASGAFSSTGAKDIVPAATSVDASFTITVPFGAASPNLTITAYAGDAAGNEGSSVPVNVIITNADITPPSTQVTVVAAPGSGATTTVTYQVTDGLTDLDHVELYFRRNGIGMFNRYTDPDHGNPNGYYQPQSGATGTISFDSTKAGGDGIHEFYSVGVDAAGNRETAPLDTGTGLVTADKSVTFTAGTNWTILASSVVVGEGDLTYDNKNIRVTGTTTFTVNGQHSFKNVELLNGATLTHAPATATTETSLDLTLWSLAVDSTSAINVDARGYLGGWQGNNSDTTGRAVVNGVKNQPGSTPRSGGSYGGLGAMSDGTPNATYGNLTDPYDLGSGGSAGPNCGHYVGGNGGGLIKIQVSFLAVDGLITANGDSGHGCLAGGGSGGAINLITDSLSGTGFIRANGGGGEMGAGGGRIAIRYRDLANLDTSHVSALAGASGYRGGNGTVYLKAVTETGGTFIADGQGTAASFTTLNIPNGQVFDNMIIRNSARIIVDTPLMVNGTLSVETGSILTHSVTLESGLSIKAKRVEIDATSAIDVSAKGYRGGWKDGNAGASGETLGGVAGAATRAGGSYGGYGGYIDGSGSNLPYGSQLDPVYLGSGGSAGPNCGHYVGGNGGGRVTITASEAVVVNGKILANGETGYGCQAGAGSGGSIKITTSFVSGTGTIAANGGGGETSGGGGRVALFVDYLDTGGRDLNGTRNINAFSGHSGTWSGAGTVYLKLSSQNHGNLYIDDNMPTGQTAPVYTPLTPIGFGKVAALTDTTLTVDGGVALMPGGLVGLTINPNLSQEQTYRITNNTATTITVDTTGIPVLTAVATAGSSYAGVHHFDNVLFRRGGYLVLGDELQVDDTMKLDEYGVLTQYGATLSFEPRLDLKVGALIVTANSSINVDARGYLGGWQGGNGTSGRAVVNGEKNALGSPPRAGGSYGGLGGVADGGPANAIYGSLTDPTDLGAGGSAGPNCGFYPGGNGGGWVKILAGTMTMDGLITANGDSGHGCSAGGGSGGTVNIVTTTLTGTGTVRVNGGGGEVSGGGGRIAIHYGTLAIDPSSFQVMGGLSGPRGGIGTLFLKQNSQTDGDLIINGFGNTFPASSTVLPQGYVFDNVTLRNGAQVTTDVPLVVNESIKLENGSVITHSRGHEAGLDVQARVVEIDATSSIDVSAKGYRGGWRDGNDTSGETLGGIAGVAPRSGGSYGGYGGFVDGAGSNLPYGSPAEPVYLGSGGSAGNNCGHYVGGNGGGRVTISAGETLQVNGKILANGEIGYGCSAGSGSGGSLKISTSLLSGTGTVAANGGGGETSGGGGRIAIYYDTLGSGGSDLNGTRNITAFSGHSGVWGSAGTVYLKKTGQLSGDLYIDDNMPAGQTAPVYSPLTTIGFGVVTGVTANALTFDGAYPVMPGALVGLTLNPNLKQSVTYLITGNTASLVTVDTTGKPVLTDVTAIGESYAGSYRLDSVMFRRGGYLVLGDLLRVDGTLTMAENAGLTHFDTTLSFTPHLDLQVGAMAIDSTSFINVNGRGYLGGWQGGNGVNGRAVVNGVKNGLGAAPRSGGSYGGLGAVQDGGPTNALYGSQTDPADLGAGGSAGPNCGTYRGGDGGGWVKILAGTMTLDGFITANGVNGGGCVAGAGSGGAVNIYADTLAGSGHISANGGGGELSGGGGRIAVHYTLLELPQSNIAATGGLGGGQGTVYFEQR